MPFRDIILSHCFLYDNSVSDSVFKPEDSSLKSNSLKEEFSIDQHQSKPRARNDRDTSGIARGFEILFDPPSRFIAVPKMMNQRLILFEKME